MAQVSKADQNAVVGYVRVSTTEQADSGAGLAAQRAAIVAEVGRKGLTLVGIYEDAGLSGKSLDRPALVEALELLRSGQASALVVAKVDRLSRSLLDFASLLNRAEREGWKLVALDLGLDMTTPAGELMAAIVAATAQYERRLISGRTKAALAQKAAQGVKLGRPRRLAPEVAARIHRCRAAGATFQAIGDELNGEHVATATGRDWTPQLVRKVALQTITADVG